MIKMTCHRNLQKTKKDKIEKDGSLSHQSSTCTGIYELYRSVQGSFHQADYLFEENAGTQCVANCLSALSYHKLKNTEF